MANAPRNSAVPTAATAVMEDRRAAVLTKHATPAANDGRDSIDGNLIIRAGDEFHSTRSGLTYRAEGSVGSGSFGVVLRCSVVGSEGEAEKPRSVAVKVVRNHPAYASQAAMEVHILSMLARTASGAGATAADSSGAGGAGEPPAQEHTSAHSSAATPTTASSASSSSSSPSADELSHIVQIRDHFSHFGHFCIVFDYLPCTLLDVLQRSGYRGFPLATVRLVATQLLQAIHALHSRGLVHSDVKPENIMLRGGDDKADGSSIEDIVLIDLGSAGYEQSATFHYVQSRFYRAPEVLLGLHYDGAIDIWSAGCVLGELFLGLPLLPGCDEHDQMYRILRLFGQLPEWMLAHGTQTSRFFVRGSDASGAWGGYHAGGLGPAPAPPMSASDSLAPTPTNPVTALHVKETVVGGSGASSAYSSASSASHSPSSTPVLAAGLGPAAASPPPALHLRSAASARLSTPIPATVAEENSPTLLRANSPSGSSDKSPIIPSAAAAAAAAPAPSPAAATRAPARDSLAPLSVIKRIFSDASSFTGKGRQRGRSGDVSTLPRPLTMDTSANSTNARSSGAAAVPSACLSLPLPDASTIAPARAPVPSDTEVVEVTVACRPKRGAAQSQYRLRPRDEWLRASTNAASASAGAAKYVSGGSGSGVSSSPGPQPKYFYSDTRLETLLLSCRSGDTGLLENLTPEAQATIATDVASSVHDVIYGNADDFYIAKAVHAALQRQPAAVQRGPAPAPDATSVPSAKVTLPKPMTRSQLADRLLFADFLSRLLCVDPLRRLTAAQALQHPWITGGTRAAAASPPAAPAAPVTVAPATTSASSAAASIAPPSSASPPPFPLTVAVPPPAVAAVPPAAATLTVSSSRDSEDAAIRSRRLHTYSLNTRAYNHHSVPMHSLQHGQYHNSQQHQPQMAPSRDSLMTRRFSAAQQPAHLMYPAPDATSGGVGGYVATAAAPVPSPPSSFLSSPWSPRQVPASPYMGAQPQQQPQPARISASFSSYYGAARTSSFSERYGPDVLAEAARRYGPGTGVALLSSTAVAPPPPPPAYMPRSRAHTADTYGSLDTSAGSMWPPFSPQQPQLQGPMLSTASSSDLPPGSPHLYAAVSSLSVPSGGPGPNSVHGSPVYGAPTYAGVPPPFLSLDVTPTAASPLMDGTGAPAPSGPGFRMRSLSSVSAHSAGYGGGGTWSGVHAGSYGSISPAAVAAPGASPAAATRVTSVGSRYGSSPVMMAEPGSPGGRRGPRSSLVPAGYGAGAGGGGFSPSFGSPVAASHRLRTSSMSGGLPSPVTSTHTGYGGGGGGGGGGDGFGLPDSRTSMDASDPWLGAAAEDMVAALEALAVSRDRSSYADDGMRRRAVSWTVGHVQSQSQHGQQQQQQQQPPQQHQYRHNSFLVSRSSGSSGGSGSGPSAAVVAPPPAPTISPASPSYGAISGSAGSGSSMDASVTTLSSGSGIIRHNSWSSRRSKQSKACTACVQAKRSCSDHRPCDRCVRIGKADECTDLAAGHDLPSLMVDSYDEGSADDSGTLELHHHGHSQAHPSHVYTPASATTAAAAASEDFHTHAAYHHDTLRHQLPPMASDEWAAQHSSGGSSGGSAARSSSRGTAPLEGHPGLHPPPMSPDVPMSSGSSYGGSLSAAMVSTPPALYSAGTRSRAETRSAGRARPRNTTLSFDGDYSSDATTADTAATVVLPVQSALPAASRSYTGAHDMGGVQHSGSSATALSPGATAALCGWLLGEVQRLSDQLAEARLATAAAERDMAHCLLALAQTESTTMADRFSATDGMREVVMAVRERYERLWQEAEERATQEQLARVALVNLLLQSMPAPHAADADEVRRVVLASLPPQVQAGSAAISSSSASCAAEVSTLGPPATPSSQRAASSLLAFTQYAQAPQLLLPVSRGGELE